MAHSIASSPLDDKDGGEMSMKDRAFPDHRRRDGNDDESAGSGKALSENSILFFIFLALLPFISLIFSPFLGFIDTKIAKK